MATNTCYNHRATWVSLMIISTMSSPEWDANPRIGWLYAGVSRRNGLFKFGGTRQCPLCRMSQQKLRSVGIAFSEDWRINEQVFLEKLGQPVKGLEWFDEPEGRSRWAIDEGVLHSLDALNFELATKFG
jgi:hypothetical protein